MLSKVSVTSRRLEWSTIQENGISPAIRITVSSRMTVR